MRMDFEGFKDYAVTHIKDYLPEEYQMAQILVSTTNHTLDPYTGMIAKIPGRYFSAIVNLEQFFRAYQERGTLSEVMGYIATTLTEDLPKCLDQDLLTDYEKMKYHLFLRLSPKNEEVMATCPYMLVGDLMLTYHISVSADTKDGFSARVTNEILQAHGILPTKLHEDALISSSKLFPPKIQTLMEAVCGIPDTLSEDEDELFRDEADDPFYNDLSADTPTALVVTNTAMTFGASVLMYTGVMEDLAKKLHGNYFIIPSSIHEVIVFPDDGSIDWHNLQMMLMEANSTLVRPEEILSENIYYYNTKEKRFRIAED